MNVKTAVKPMTRREMAKRLADDVPEGWYVNLGIGAPLQVADYVPAEREVVFQSENGVLGMGPAPAPDTINRWLINAGKQYVTLRTGGSYMHHADSFALIRGGHLDLCVLGAFQVAENGDIANWSTSDNESAPAVGGAMDLAAGAPHLGDDGSHHQDRREPARSSLQLSADRARLRQACLHQSRHPRRHRGGLCGARDGRRHDARRLAESYRRAAAQGKNVAGFCPLRASKKKWAG